MRRLDRTVFRCVHWTLLYTSEFGRWLSINFLLLTFPSIAALHVRIAVPALIFAFAVLTRSFSVCSSTSLGQPRTPSPANLSLTLTKPIVYWASPRRTMSTIPNQFRSHFPITMRCTGVASAYQRESLLLPATSVIATVIGPRDSDVSTLSGGYFVSFR